MADHDPISPPACSIDVAVSMTELRIGLGDRNSIRAARAAVVEALQAEASTIDVDVSMVLTAELVANAERHGGGAIELVVNADASSLCVSVRDRNQNKPRLLHPDELDEEGRGIWMIDRLATAWGSRLLADGGKLVWFQSRAVTCATAEGAPKREECLPG